MAFGFVALAAAVVFIGLPRRTHCVSEDPTSGWQILGTTLTATAALVVATFAAVRTRSRWGVWGCAVAMAVFGGLGLLFFLVLKDASPCFS
jgi:hypothetical protein